MRLYFLDYSIETFLNISIWCYEFPCQHCFSWISQSLLRSVLFSLQVLRDFLVIFLFLSSSLILLWSEHTLYGFDYFKFFEICFMTLFWVCSVGAWSLKRMCILLLVWFNLSLSLLIFCLLFLLIIEKRVLKSPAVIVDFSLFSFSFVISCTSIGWCFHT